MLINDINARLGEIDAELELLAALPDPTADDVARSEELISEAEERRAARIAANERSQRIAAAHATAKVQNRDFGGSPFQIMTKVDAYGTDLPLATGITATITEGDPDDVTVTVVPLRVVPPV